MLRQPAFINSDIQLRIRDSKLLESKKLSEKHYAMIPNTDKVMNGTFWLGVWPGLSKESLLYVCDKLTEIIKK